jgi:beta-lactamase class A
MPVNHRILRTLVPLCLSMLLSNLSGAVDQDEVQRKVRVRIGTFPGRVGIFARNLATGAEFNFHGDDPVRTASTIKLPIMLECFFEVKEGKLKWNDPIRVTHDEKVSGSGVLTELSDDVQLPIRDLMHLMIVVSDNTATNLILNRITGDAVNARMEKLGLLHTRNMRKILGDGNNLKPEPSGITQEGAKPENKRWGIGRSTPREMVTILDKLYRGQLVDAESSKEMIEVLKRQQYHEGIARWENGRVPIASKSGALDHLRSDVAIVYVPEGPIAMAITVDDIPQDDWSVDNPGHLLIADLSKILLGELGRK